MAIPRQAFLVHMKDGSGPHLVMTETDARTYPGRAGSQQIVVIRGDNAGEFFALDPSRHAYAESPPMVFDSVAADARKALRIAARSKLTAEECTAVGLVDVES